MPFQLKSEARVSNDFAGLSARFALPPVMFVSAPPEPAAPIPSPPATAPTAPRALSGRAIVVEDNMIIAMESEDALRDLGAASVDVAASVAETMALIDSAPPAFALLDVNLGAETSVPVAERLAGLGTPFVFATGYGEQARVAGDFAAVPVVSKPFSRDDLARAI